MNEIGLASLEFDRPLAAAEYATDRTFGSLVLIDRMTNRTLALGVIEHTAAQSPSDPVPLPVRRDRLHRAIGTAGSTKRAMFLQLLAGRMLRGLVLYALVVLLSGNMPLGVVIGVADVGLSPLLNHAVASIWRHWRHLRGPANMASSS
jgi:hypothetical protein